MAVMAPRDPLGRAALRTVLIVVGVALTLYIMYQLRKPITWLVIAAFIAIAMSGPVNLLQRLTNRRRLSIGLAYAGLVLIPIAIAAVLIPTIVNQIEELAGNVPEYAQDVTDFVNENDTLNNLNEKYDFTSEIESLAGELPSKIGDAAGLLQDIGVGVVNSIFAAVTILILSIFMVASGDALEELARQGAATRPRRASRPGACEASATRSATTSEVRSYRRRWRRSARS